MSGIAVRHFFESIHGAGDGLAVITLKDSQGGLSDDNYFLYPAELDEMVKFVEDHTHLDVYTSPVLFQVQSPNSRLKQHAKTVSVAYSDSDTCDPSNYRIEPSLVVRTAEGRWHTYWYLDGDYNPHIVALLNRRMAHAHHAQGADNAFGNAAKLLRVPETTNHRRNDHVVIESESGAVYSLAELEAQYPTDEFPEKVYPVDRPMPSQFPDRTEILNRIPDDRLIRNLLFDPVPQGVDRSNMRYKLESELFRAGFSPEEVTALVWDAPCCKFKDAGRPMQHLWNEVLTAEVDPNNQPPVFDPNDPVFHEDDGAPLVELKTVIEKVEFLSEEERDSLVVTFIDRWQQWAASKTTSHPKYHRAAALTAMSTVYSEFGYLPAEFANIMLNVWVMLLGNTTLDRKSTSRDYLTDIIDELETEQYQYNIGSDATQQGLNKLLSDKPNQSSLLHRDEVQGMLKELFGQSFLTGLTEYFTDLYGGKSRGTVRSTGDKQFTKSVPTSFLMYLMGITEEATELLTIKNFKSGFLTRFVYTVVEPRPYNPAHDEVRMAPVHQGVYRDIVREGLINELAMARNFWEMQTTRDKKKPIRPTEEALARFNQFRTDITHAVVKLNSAQADTLRASVERLTITVLKTAALFAMHHNRSTVELEDVLSAIDLAEEWFYDLLKISTMVSESTWQREVNKLEQFVAGRPNGRAGYDSAYKQFPDMKPKDFRELVEALEYGGRIKQDKLGNKIILEITRGSDDASAY